MAEPQSQPQQPSATPEQHTIPDTEKQSLLSDTEHAFNITHAANDEHGTIVTDKRRRRQTIFGAFKDAASEWTEENSETVKQLEVFQKPVVPKIAPGTERKEIIEKAVMTPQQEAQDDHKVVMERIKTFQSDAERVTGRPFIVKKDLPKKKGWSHMIGEEKTPEKALPTSGKNYPEVQHIHREDVTAQSHSQPIAPTVETRTNVPLPAEEQREPSPAPVPPTPEPITPRISEPAPKPPVAEEIPMVVPEPAPEPEPIREVRRPIVPPTPQPAPIPQIRERSSVGIFVAITLLVLITLGGIGTGVYLFLNREPVVAGVTVPTFIKADTKEALPLSNDRTVLLSSLEGALKGGSGEFLHLYLVYESETEGTETLATTADFFGVLQPRTSGAFVRSLDERMMLGGVQVTSMEPFMLLKSNAFDTAFAGMLEWESFMSADLAPYFGTPVARSFDPTARSADRTTAPTFTDKAIANHNVRVLYDETGTERIVYGFVNRNTIIVTSTGAAFEKLLGALQ